MLQLKYPLILASRSPRRKHILEEAGFEFRVEVAEVEEECPENFRVEEVPVYLAEKKARYFKDQSQEAITLAADTVVSIEGQILGKPSGPEEAKAYLELLSGNTHHVTTGVALLAEGSLETFSDTTAVVFRDLKASEIDYYVDQFKPFDKAGAYAIQEWIGMIGITEIMGSYFNVMGLPIHRVYERLGGYFMA